MNHVRTDVPPFLILHSDDDWSVPIANALLMVDALNQAGARLTFHRYEKLGHMGINDEVIARTREFIASLEP